MSAHTPGPWFQHPSNDGSVIRIEVAWGERPIAYIESGEANARLIAAAPDLLEALKATFHPNNPEPWDVVEARAKKAIAKAEGR